MTYKDEDVSLKNLTNGAHSSWKWTADADTRAALVAKMQKGELSASDLTRYRSECKVKAVEYATAADLTTTMTEETELYQKAQALFDDIDLIDAHLKMIPCQMEIPR